MVNITEFPIVWMSDGKEDGKSDIEDFKIFDEILSKKEVFVILRKNEEQEEIKKKQSSEEKKYFKQWAKENKEKMKKFILGMIVIEESSINRIGIKTFGKVFGIMA